MTPSQRPQPTGEWAIYLANLALSIRIIWENLTSPSSPESSATPTPAQPCVEVRHDTRHVTMSVNTDALAADWSRRDDRHEERIPCRREGPEAAPGAQDNEPNFIFGDAARQENRRPQMINMQYTNSSTTISVYNNATRSIGLNIGVNGLGFGLGAGQGAGLGLGLGGGMPGMSFLSINGDLITVILGVLFAIWYFGW
ncbi:hypothetical protein F4803DRAFT_557803 [Xylaria telfairii]|nr:hypothetical protein F4803DRAFT_557803 [Xylaria telfairii]